MYYYNPNVYKPKPSLINIHEVPENRYEWYSKITKEPFAPYKDEATALNSRWTGICRFWKDGKLYEANHVAENSYQPVNNGEVKTHFGINWDTYFACDKTDLTDYLAKRYETIFGAEPTYDEIMGLWSIQVHYDGRCR